jgi:hypothetical protein
MDDSDFDFFMSHASPDKVDVEEYAGLLDGFGASVAFDKYHIRPGEDWIDRVLELLDSSKICLVFVSTHSSAALVQGHETFLGRYLAKKYPERHLVLPIYLRGAPPQTDLLGLQTTSGYREDTQSRPDIAKDLIEQRDRLGDAANRAMRAIDMIDDLAMKWLFPPGHDRFGVRFTLDGASIHLTQHDFPAGSIERDEFDTMLSTEDLRLVSHLEHKLELLYREWERNDLDTVMSRDAQARADEFARLMGGEVVKLLDLLQNAGFQLSDHYGHIRAVVANYYKSSA